MRNKSFMFFTFLLLANSTAFASCKGEPAIKCETYSSDKNKCNSHYKMDATGIGAQCYWTPGAMYGGYCLPSVTPCM